MIKRDYHAPEVREIGTIKELTAQVVGKVSGSGDCAEFSEDILSPCEID